MTMYLGAIYRADGNDPVASVDEAMGRGSDALNDERVVVGASAEVRLFR